MPRKSKSVRLGKDCRFRITVELDSYTADKLDSLLAECEVFKMKASASQIVRAAISEFFAKGNLSLVRQAGLVGQKRDC